MKTAAGIQREGQLASAALRIVAIYLAVGLLWITLSDTVVNTLVGDLQSSQGLQFTKGVFFVLATTLLLYLLIRRGLSTILSHEQALLKSEARYRTLIEQASDGIFIANTEGALVEANTRGCEMLGYTRDELLKLKVTDILAPGEAEDGHKDLPLLQAGFTVLSEHTMCRKDGTTFPAEISTKLLSDGSFQGIARDITERRASQHRLESYAQQQTELLGRLMTAQEAERRRVGMDIHDGPLQSLGVTVLAVDRALRRYRTGEHHQAYDELQSVRTGLGSVVNELRAVLADLSLDVLTTQGLPSALRGYAGRFSELTGIKVSLQTDLEERLPAELELLFYRLAQESLSNIRKHSHATSAQIQLGRQNGEVQMAVSDDGEGFVVEEGLARHLPGRGIGLRSMSQRIKDARGSLIIESEPGKGTRLIFKCPIGSTED